MAWRFLCKLEMVRGELYSELNINLSIPSSSIEEPYSTNSQFNELHLQTVFNE